MSKKKSNDARKSEVFSSVDAACQAMLTNKNLNNTRARHCGLIVPLYRVEKNERVKEKEFMRLSGPKNSDEKVTVAIIRALDKQES